MLYSLTLNNSAMSKKEQGMLCLLGRCALVCMCMHMHTGLCVCIFICVYMNMCVCILMCILSAAAFWQRGLLHGGKAFDVSASILCVCVGVPYIHTPK